MNNYPPEYYHDIDMQCQYEAEMNAKAEAESEIMFQMEIAEEISHLQLLIEQKQEQIYELKERIQELLHK
jgi:hypothetical protein